jgi:SAM-dependent methyltransferase
MHETCRWWALATVSNCRSRRRPLQPREAQAPEHVFLASPESIELTAPQATPSLDGLVRLSGASFDFIDLGCSRGGSVKHCVRRFGAERGLGVDLDEGKVQDARAAGVEAVRADATALQDEVRFVSEHVP